MKVTKEEYGYISERMGEYMSGSRQMDPKLREQYAEGSRSFWENYRSTETVPELMREKLNEAQQGMDLRQRTFYLANTLFAVTELTGISLGEINNTLDAQALELLEMIRDDKAAAEELEPDRLEALNRELTDLICENAKACSLVIGGLPVFEELNEVCKNAATREEVAAAIEATENNAVMLAAAIHDCCLEGKLPSLKTEKDLSPQYFGVAAAASLEVGEAVRQSFGKELMQRVSKVFEAVLVTAAAVPFVKGAVIGIKVAMKSILASGLPDVLVGVASLTIVGTAVIVGGWLALDYIVKPLITKAAPVLREASAKVRETVTENMNRALEWLRRDVVPKAKAFCEKAKRFLSEKLFEPVRRAVKNAAQSVKSAVVGTAQPIRTDTREEEVYTPEQSVEPVKA